jgi:hypothetical protein
MPANAWPAERYLLVRRVSASDFSALRDHREVTFYSPKTTREDPCTAVVRVANLGSSCPVARGSVSVDAGVFA